MPLGRKEFEDWADDIYLAADIPGLSRESAHFALAEMILHVKPTQSFESYGHFVHALRKGAANQVAHAIFTEIKEAQKKRTQEKSVTPNGEKILADTKIQSVTK